MLSNKLSHRLDKYIAPFVRLLARFGVTPNTLTVAGAITNGVAAATLLYGHFRVGGILILLGGLCDLLDGALARTLGQESRFGGLLDSTLDRYSDILPILGLMLYYSGWTEGGVFRFGGMILCGVVVLGSFLVPYVRARAETIIERCDVGIAERAERIIIFAGGLVFNADIVALWILAVLTHITVMQRLWYVNGRLKRRNEVESESGRHTEKRIDPIKS